MARPPARCAGLTALRTVELELAPPRARIDNAMVKALARAYRWRNLLDTGPNATLEETAAVEKILASHTCRRV